MTGRPRSRRGGALALALVLTLAAGCGAGAGESPGGASLLVTRNFGAEGLECRIEIPMPASGEPSGNL